MSVVVGKNNIAADGPVTPPPHPDGIPWPYCMYFQDGGMVAFADNYTDLLHALIPGYQKLNKQDRERERIRLGQGAAAYTQGYILVDVDESTVSPEEWKALIAPRGGTQPSITWWESDIPLILVETSYEPFTHIPRPAAKPSAERSDEDSPAIWWVRPSDEEDFLTSLHEIGFIRIMTFTPEVPTTENAGAEEA